MKKQQAKILNSLLNPQIADFIDWKKFILSDLFEDIAKDAIEHFVEHGDSTPIKRLLDPLSRRKIFKPVLFWFCDSAGLDYEFHGELLRLTRAKDARSLQGSLAQYLAKHTGSAKDLGAVSRKIPSRQSTLNKLLNPDGVKRGGSPFVQGGAPGLGKRS